MVTLPLGRRTGQEPLARDVRVNIVAFVLLVVPGAAGIWLAVTVGNPLWLLLGLVIGFTLMQSPKVAKQWERAVVLRLGRYLRLPRPGLFWILPFVETVTKWIDQRVITTSFAAEETLTSDTVPVNVDAV